MARSKSWLACVLALVAGAAVAQDPLVPSVKSAVAGPMSRSPIAKVVGAPPRHELEKTDVDAWLDGYLPYALNSGDIPGAVVMVVKDGTVLTARGFGYADLAKRRPVDPARTLFRPGSVSKLVTWTAVMQLVEQGKLDLDRDVNVYLDFRIPPREGKPVTLRQILTHTAGFEEQAKAILFYDPALLKPIGRFLKDTQPKRIYAPGSTPAYSNWATTLAAYIVERRSDEPFELYVERHIFQPLGMQTATFRQPLPKPLVAWMATGYPKPGEGPAKFELIGPGPAGALSASGADMARFMIAHLQGGELDGKRILAPSTAAMMHDSPLAKVDPYSLIPPLNRMELGFFESNANGNEVIAHLGDTSAFHTSLHLFPNDAVGLYVSFNGSGKAGAAGTVRGALFQDFTDRYFPGTGGDGRVDAKSAARHAEMMTGLWQNSRRSESSFLSLAYLLGQSKVTVGPNGDLVVAELHGANGRPREWVEIAPFVWRDKYGEDRLAAKLVDGRVVRWSFDGISPFMVFDRVPAGRSSAWILPALYASLAVLLLTALYWPVTWFVRRRYQSPLSVRGASLRAYRATRIMALLDLVMLGAWGAAITLLFANYDMLTDRSDPWLWMLQIAGAIVFVGAAAITGWNAWLTFRDKRKWTRKVWNLLVFLAALTVLMVAIRFNLIAMSVKY